MWKYLAMIVGLLTGGITIKMMIEIVLGKGTPKPVVYGLTVLILITSVVYLVDAQERACGQNKDLHWMCVAKWELPKMEPRQASPSNEPAAPVLKRARYSDFPAHLEKYLDPVFCTKYGGTMSVPDAQDPISYCKLPFTNNAEWEKWCLDYNGNPGVVNPVTGRKSCSLP